MKISVKKLLKNNKYQVTIATTLNDVELDKVDKFGEPLVNVGGSFTGPPAFTLANNLRGLKNGFPFTLTLDGAADADAEAKADVWAAEEGQRLSDTVAVLIAKIDNFSDDALVTVP